MSLKSALFAEKVGEMIRSFYIEIIKCFDGLYSGNLVMRHFDLERPVLGVP